MAETFYKDPSTESGVQPSQGGGGMPGGGATGGVQPLAATALQQQLASIRQFQQLGQQHGRSSIGRSGTNMPLAAASSPGGQPQLGSTNLNELAQRLAEQYGLSIGRGPLVDENGNFNYTPDQLAAASGGAETMGTAAAKMNYISAAIARQQQMQAQQRASSTLQAGIGLVQNRGRGSLAAMQSGMYQSLAGLYANQEYEAADFSYFIQREQQQIALDIIRRQEKLAKKQAIGGFVAGVFSIAGGILSGNPLLIAQGAGGVAGNAGGTGWF